MSSSSMMGCEDYTMLIHFPENETMHILDRESDTWDKKSKTAF